MSKFLGRIVGRILDGSSTPSADDDALPPGPHPAKAPADSEWAQQRNVDFFVNPALTMDTLSYLNPNGSGPEGALRERYGLPPRQAADARDHRSDDGSPDQTDPS
jgi:hypothetical protein